jgi:hypothetical protein
MSGIFFGLASRWIRPIPPPITVQITGWIQPDRCRSSDSQGQRQGAEAPRQMQPSKRGSCLARLHDAEIQLQFADDLLAQRPIIGIQQQV